MSSLHPLLPMVVSAFSSCDCSKMSTPVRPDNQELSSHVPLRIDTNGLPPSPLSLNSTEIRSTETDRQETQLQECWDTSIAKHMNLPDGYHNVHVLMIKWEDSIDQLGVRGEVDELSNVFSDVFKYEVEEVQLGTSKPQHQLEHAISGFTLKHDEPENLLILYYAGHGIYDRKTKVLELTPINEVISGPKVIWNRAESTLIETVKADVLTIMDCCYASDILRNVPESSRTFEMLAASQIGETTAQPGDDSFTRCLIKHLKVLADESHDSFFTTRDIEERMRKERHRQAPALWRRVPGNSRHIRLSKLKPMPERPKTNKQLPSHERFLHLGFALRYNLFEERHIEALTKELPSLFREVGVPLVNISWLGCRKVGNPNFREIAGFVVRNRKSLSAISPPSDKKRNSDEAGLGEGSAAREKGDGRNRKISKRNTK